MSFAAVNALDVPPYQVQQLVERVLEGNDGFELGAARSPTKAAFSKPAVTCAQALGSEIYVGCSDGSLLRFALQANGPNSPESYTLLSRQTLPTNKQIDEIALTPSVSRALILSDHQIHFYIIPSLDPVPQQIMRPIRNVVSFAVDDQHMRLPPPSLSEAHLKVEPIEFCVIKRTNIALYNLSERLVLQREIPFQQGITTARRTGRFLCAADQENYNIIDLQTSTLVPLLPIPPGPELKPSISVINENEFLLLSSVGVGLSTMGLFISGSGDPVRGTLEWPSYPTSLCLDYPYIAALLPNQTIEIHNIETQAIAQVVSAPSGSPRPSSPASDSTEPRSLSSSPVGYLVPSTQRTNRLRLVSVPLIPAYKSEHPAEPSGSGLTPPPVPSKMPNTAARPSVFPRSNALVLSANSIQSLLPSTLISQAESLLESHRIEDAVDLADQNQRKLLGTMTVNEDQAEELRYVYQRVGFQCLSETLFDDAGRHLLSGEVDPRMLVRYFPDLRGNLLESSPTIELFAGVAEHLPQEGTIEEIVIANIVRNYSPHMAPNTYEAPPTAELRRVLCSTARDVLAKYLRKCRTRRLLDRSGADSQTPAISKVVDTVLVKILAESESTRELYTLIDEPNDIDLSEVEEPLKKNGQYNALCKLYAKAGDEEKLLDAWSKLLDGVWSDEDVKDPMARMTELLNRTSNKSLVQRWALWLTNKDPDLGLKLLISRDSKRTSKNDELALLEQIGEADAAAGVKYLEYLVLQKRSKDRDLHQRLASVYVDRLMQSIADEATSKLWRAKASSYASNSTSSTFLAYFASTTPESEQRDIRLKAILFLQGSDLYDVEEVFERIQAQRKILRLEMAILFGKLGRHREAISTLVHDVHDPTTAEAYCTLGGEVIPGKVAIAVGERSGLQRWAALVTGVAPGVTPSSSRASGMMRQKTADEGTKRELLKVLLSVYMSGGTPTVDRTSRLLNSQAMNLDVVDVIELVPPDWPLSAMSSFLARSFRRALHAGQEGQIVKAIAAGQNLEVVENAWAALSEAGAVIEEAADDEEDGGDEKSLSEKVGLHEPRSPSSVAEIRVDERKEAAEAAAALRGQGGGREVFS